jgi:hypothetical protein
MGYRLNKSRYKKGYRSIVQYVNVWKLKGIERASVTTLRFRQWVMKFFIFLLFFSEIVFIYIFFIFKNHNILAPHKKHAIFPQKSIKFVT